MNAFTTFSPPGKPHIVCHAEYEQGSEEWLQARCGLLTASEMKLIVTEKTMKAASNDRERAHLYELLAQRVTQHVEPHYIGDDMLRGHEDEVYARLTYAEHYAPVTTDTAFMTNDRWGFTLGYSPDGLVGNDGAIEAKSRRQKLQMQTLVEGGTPPEHAMQLQTGLLVSERQWIDYVSYSGGMPMYVHRVYPDAAIHEAIVNIAGGFEARLADKLKIYEEAAAQFVPTKRRVEQEMF
jgi:hypothetical protein